MLQHKRFLHYTREKWCIAIDFPRSIDFFRLMVLESHYTEVEQEYIMSLLEIIAVQAVIVAIAAFHLWVFYGRKLK